MKWVECQNMNENKSKTKQDNGYEKFLFLSLLVSNTVLTAIVLMIVMLFYFEGFHFDIFKYIPNDRIGSVKYQINMLIGLGMFGVSFHYILRVYLKLRSWWSTKI